MAYPQRRPLDHAVPSWVRPGAVFFLTLCTHPRGHDVLCQPATSRAVLESARFRHETGLWWLHTLLLMPDHLHALIAFPDPAEMPRRVRDWKRYLARTAGVPWQRNFFDHRVRSEAALTEKAAYIRQNPVRAGLVCCEKAWPHVLTTADLP